MVYVQSNRIITYYTIYHLVHTATHFMCKDYDIIVVYVYIYEFMRVYMQINIFMWVFLYIILVIIMLNFFRD